jgi:hypothetical protein
MRFAKAITLTPSGTASTQAPVRGHRDAEAGYADGHQCSSGAATG